MNPRKAAFLSLLRMEKAGKYANLEIDAAIRKYHLEETDRALFTNLVYGTIERAICLDYVIGCFSAQPLEKITPEVRVILRLGLYQILFLDRIPDHAAVNESVELCKAYRRSAASFVNAVLRRAVRERDGIVYPDPATEYGISAQLYQLWCAQYGQNVTERILHSLREPAYITLRANTLQITPEQLRREIECETELTQLCPGGVRLLENMPVSDFAPLEDGLCFVQDEASQYAAHLVGARRGMTVIDACACPGGKSFSMALDMQNEGKIFSFDLHSNKLSLIERGAQKLGIDIIETQASDGTIYRPELAQAADRVLCDVPCSGLGVLRKKPDLRHKDLSQIERLPEVQYAILANCARYVKVGGRLLYSTCTLNRAENEAVVERFLIDHPEFVPDPFEESEQGFMRTIFPYENGTDGFFIARIIRRD